MKGIYFLKPKLGTTKKFQHLTRAEGVVVTRLHWPYLVPGTDYYLPPLWSNADHSPYAPVVYSVAGNSWQILNSWLIEYSIRRSFRNLQSGVYVRSATLLSDFNDQTFHAIPHLNRPQTDATTLTSASAQTFLIRTWVGYHSVGVVKVSLGMFFGDHIILTLVGF